MSVRWKLKELLEREGVTPYALAQQMGGASRRPTIYAITSPDLEQRPKRVGFELLDDILAALKVLKGRPFSVAEIIEDDEVKS